MTHSVLIRGGRVISPADAIDSTLDIFVERGVIRRIAPEIDERADEEFDARGQIVGPGFIDLHVHLREPGGEESETLETGLAAAAAGGFTAVCPMPNTRPVNDSPQATRAMIEKARQTGLGRLFPIAAASIASEGETLTDFTALKAAGAVAFSDDGRPLKTSGLMLHALERAHALGMVIIDHCEDLSVSVGGAVNAGPLALRLGLKGVPNASEDVCLSRDLVLAAETGARLHVAHLSTATAVEMVRLAKTRGVLVSCEVTPHHFTLTDEAVAQWGTSAKMNPPLRSAPDREAVLAGLADGAIDAIATDHAPHAPRLKAQPLATAPFGVTGLETALGLAITQLVEPGRITLNRLIDLMSAQPARILNLPHGRLRVGGDADLTVFDAGKEWTYRASEGKSKSFNSPFDGWTLRGAVTATMVGGKIVYRRPE
jgi:dihydroorotase